MRPDAPVSRRGRRRCLAVLPALALAVTLPLPRAAQAQAQGCVRYPFELELDLDVVTALVRTPPAQLMRAIGERGIDVLRVPSQLPGRTPNPLLIPLPEAPAALLARARFLPEYQGRAIPRGSDCCGLARDTVLIRDDASTYTLLHEVVHLLITPAGGHAFRQDVELRFDLALHRLTIYQRSLYNDAWRLMNPLWRRDILAAQREVAELLYERIRIGQSQEAVIERALGGCIVPGSPYFDAQRRDEGRRYAVAMIDNAVDVFNAVHASLVFCEEAVTDLRAEVAAGRVREDAREHLSAADATAFVAESRAIRSTLEPVREAIEALKRLYAAS